MTLTPFEQTFLQILRELHPEYNWRPVRPSRAKDDRRALLERDRPAA